MKPHVYQLFGLWHCCGLGYHAKAITPRLAFQKWKAERVLLHLEFRRRQQRRLSA